MAVTIASIVLAAATGSLLRQQRTTTALLTLGGASAQLRPAVALLPAQLSLAASAEDLVQGELRDTVVQLRATIAAGIACDRSVVVSLASGEDVLATGAVASMPHASDSLWWFDPDAARWYGQRISDAWTESLPCPAEAAASAVLRLRTDDARQVPALSPIRITRQVRLAPYRSSDGSWQLGMREWSDATAGFAGPQPVAGPVLRIGDDGSRTGFRYFDAAGAALDPAADPGARLRVARIRFGVLLPQGAAAGGAAFLRDSVDVALRPPDVHAVP